MATNEQDELDYLANRVAKGTMPGNARYIFSKTDWEEFKAALAQHTKEAEIKARLVELDLLEQFINREGIRGSMYRYKLLRLEDLENRLAELAAPTASPQQGGQKDE